MKTRIATFLLLLFLLCSFTACHYEFPEGGDSYFSTSCTVTFHPENGETATTVTVPSGERIFTPAVPEKEDAVFLGWYTDEALTTPYDFSGTVSHDLDLYAGYLPDYVTWTNRITDAFVPACVSINTVSATDGFFASVSGKSGSGILFYRNVNLYYVLTNNHVVSLETGYTRISYQVEDYRGNTYDGVTLVASDPGYDLAVLCFHGPTGSDTLPIATLAAENVAEGTPVAALGHPSGQKNALTYGEVAFYRTADLSDRDSDITFPVLYHTAPIAAGSSGGAVVNSRMEVVAINYAEGTYDGEFAYGLAIPVEAVREFLEAAGFIIAP